MTTATVIQKISVAAAGAALVTFGVSGPAQAAGFSGAYDPDNWTFTTSNADTDAFVDTTDAPLSISLADGDPFFYGFSGFSGQTDYTTTAASSGLVSFDWNYITTDLDKEPFFNRFGFIFNGAFTQLTDNIGSANQLGFFSTSVAAGDTFGFAIQTLGSSSGPASVTISNFTAPESVPESVPEPASIIGLFAFGVMGAGSMLKRKQQQKATVEA